MQNKMGLFQINDLNVSIIIFEYDFMILIQPLKAAAQMLMKWGGFKIKLHYTEMRFKDLIKGYI